LLQFFGQFHPAIVHFPLALLLVAVLAESISWFTGKQVFHHVGACNLHMAAISAIPAAAFGWALAAYKGTETDLESTLFWHRWVGTGAAVWALIALVAWYRYRKEGNDGGIWFYRFSLLVGGVLVGISGHLGGVLVYGLDYYSWSLH
jgi:uncharacterized membrane protein